MSATKKPQGEIRQSQLVTTFGPGSMVDLPNHSVLVCRSGILVAWAVNGFGAAAQLSKLARVLEYDSVNCARRRQRMTANGCRIDR